MKLSVHITTMRGSTLDEINTKIREPQHLTLHNHGARNPGYMPYQQNVLNEETADIIGFLHDDLTLLEPWEERVIKEFEASDVAIVGFGGATGVGHPDIYKVPYHYTQLARANFLSNMVDAEKHGQRFTGERDIAFLDSFSMFIRREWLLSVGGYPVDRYAPSHMSDCWLCLKAWQTGNRVRLVGVSCEHTGGGAGPEYPKWCATTKWGSDEAMHQYNHRLIYEEFSSLLPFSVEA